MGSIPIHSRFTLSLESHPVAPNETHWQSLKASTQCQTHQFLWFYFFDHHNEYTYISFFGLELSHNWCAAACFYKLIQLCF